MRGASQTTFDPPYQSNLSLSPVSGSPESYGYQRLPNSPSPLPFRRPPFTFQDIRAAIPPHCFIRSTLISLLYTLENVTACLILFWLSFWIDYIALSLPLWLGLQVSWPATWLVQLTLWTLYWFLQGAYMFGLWILAHECGHEAYSTHPILNHVVGLTFHTFLLVPYDSWRFVHAKHHRSTGHPTDEQVYNPRTRSQASPCWIEILEESSLFLVGRTLLVLFLGLLPLYLLFNLSGPIKYIGKNVNHFSPNAVFFAPHHKPWIILSDTCYFVWVGVILFTTYATSVSTVMAHYGIPLLLTNHYLILVTYLQHTDVYVPNFRGEEWTWLRGSLCTVDRSFGPWLDRVFHHVADTHLVHHLFPKLPFYHAKEATEAIKPIMGEYYARDETPIYAALWRVVRNCKFIEDQGPIAFYKRKITAD